MTFIISTLIVLTIFQNNEHVCKRFPPFSVVKYMMKNQIDGDNLKQSITNIFLVMEIHIQYINKVKA